MARDLYRFMVWCSGEPFFDDSNILIIKIPYHDVCGEHVVSSVNLVTEGNETRLQVELSWKVYSHFHSPAMPKKRTQMPHAFERPSFSLSPINFPHKSPYNPPTTMAAALMSVPSPYI
jgi:hypothetical protein